MNLDGILDSRCLSECPSNSFSDISFGLSAANKRGKSVHSKTDNKAVIIQTRHPRPIVMNISNDVQQLQSLPSSFTFWFWMIK